MCYIYRFPSVHMKTLVSRTNDKHIAMQRYVRNTPLNMLCVYVHTCLTLLHVIVLHILIHICTDVIMTLCSCYIYTCSAATIYVFVVSI